MSWHGLVAYDETKRGSRGERERVKERVGREKKSVKEGERGRRRGREKLGVRGERVMVDVREKECLCRTWWEELRENAVSNI